MFKKRGKGQSWSLDIILAFVVFVLIIGIFYTLVSQNKKDKTQDLTLESNTIVSNLDAANGLNTLSVINKGNIDQQRVQNLYDSSYNSIKQQFGIRGDFCIYMIDQYGNIITIDTSKGQLAGFGNGNFTINDKPCGTPVN